MPEAGKASTDRAAPVVVVGGGVVGLSCALALARAGVPVRVLDEAAALAPASWGNAGHLATEQVEPLASPAALRSVAGRLYAFGGALSFRAADATAWLPFAWRYARACTPAACARGRLALGALLADALPAWQRLGRTLDDATLVDAGGHLVVWEHARSAARGAAAWRATGIGTARMEPLAHEALAALGARLRRRLYGGLRFTHTGQVADPQRVLEDLRRALALAGGEREPGRVTGFGAGTTLLLADGRVLAAPRVLVAAGVGSRALMEAAGHPTPLIAERGYHVEGDREGWDDLPPVVFEDRSMIITRFGTRLRAASFVEFARRNAPPDPAKWARLRRHVAELGVPLREPLAPWYGCRPTLPDYLPAMGLSRRRPGLAYAFGHQHLGLTLAATTGELMGALLTGATPRTSLAPFDLERFCG